MWATRPRPLPEDPESGRLGQRQARRESGLRVQTHKPHPRAVCEAAAEPGSADPTRTVSPQAQAACASA